MSQQIHQMRLQNPAPSVTLRWQVSQPAEVYAMTTRTPHKLNLNMAAGSRRGLRGAASPQTAIGAGAMDGSLAERLKR
jgi:hypothetical protein